MARGRSFQRTGTGNATLDGIQQAIADTFAQLEDLRRGMLVGSVVSEPGPLQLGEHLIAIYTGPGAQTWMLPLADLRGAGRGQVLAISNAGGGNLSVTASGTNLVNGAAALVLAAGASAMLFSDGGSRWRAVV
jgi:hypothetical protein